MEGGSGSVMRVADSSAAEMASEDCCVGDVCWAGNEDFGKKAAGLRRGDVRSIGDCGAGCVPTPGREMSKERSSVAAELCCVRSGVMRRLCSG